MTMGEYIEWLLAGELPAIQAVVQNILDKPIPQATKKCLLKLQLPRLIPQSASANLKSMR